MVLKPRVIVGLSSFVVLAVPFKPTVANASPSKASQCYVLFQSDVERAAIAAGAAANPPETRVRGIPGVPLRLLRADMTTLLSRIEFNYGPRALKEKTIGLVWDNFKNRILSSLNKIQSSFDYNYAVADALNSLNDAHVSVSLQSTLKYTLPIQFSRYADKILVSYLEESQLRNLAGGRLPAKGDYLVAVNGMSVWDYQKTNPYFAKYGNDITNSGMFARLISSLSETSGYPVSRTPQDVKLTFISRATGETFDYATKYTSKGAGLSEDGQPPATSVNLGLTAEEKALLAISAKAEAVRDYFRGLFVKRLKGDGAHVRAALLAQMEKFHSLVNLSTDLRPSKRAKPAPRPMDAIGHKFQIGDRMPFFKLPADFKPLKFTNPKVGALMNEDSFLVGTFERDGKHIGFLRIPAYEVEMPETLLASLRLYIGLLESSTDELIIDQTYNPGGMVAMSDMVVKSLVGQYDDSKHMKFRVKPNPAFVRNFIEMIDTIRNAPEASFLNPLEKADFIDRLSADLKKVQEAARNHEDLSEPVSFRVMSELMERQQEQLIRQSPDLQSIGKAANVDLTKPQVYTKKVYFMINEFDASGGDATPAVLQDYGRVVLVGQRTMGAGGSVEEFSDRNFSDISYHLTTSLMYRKDGQYIENYGVHPDVRFDLIEQDVMDDYANVFDRMLQTIKESGK